MDPRLVLVYRPSEYEEMMGSYGSFGNARYQLASASRVSNSDDPVFALNAMSISSTAGGAPDQASYAAGRRTVLRAAASRSERESNVQFESAQSHHERFMEVLNRVEAQFPESWRVARVKRNELDRFLFEPDDIVTCVGQDGLVANVAKYLHDNQPVIGVNPDPDRNPGVLVAWGVEDFPSALNLAERKVGLSQRTMVKAVLDNGQTLTALNEVFIGHAGHQSARYQLRYAYETERQSSSGIIVATGTGATGWARSINESYAKHPDMPAPDEERLAFFVREPWPSPGTGTTITVGNVTTATNTGLSITSEMESGGVIFGDGIEVDHLEFAYGRIAAVLPAEQHLQLVVP